MAIPSSNSSANMDEDSDSFSMSLLERQIKFYALLLLQAPALLCTIFM